MRTTLLRSFTPPLAYGGTLNSAALTPVCLSWPVLRGFIRIATNARVHRRPMSVQEATDRIQGWLDQPCVRVVVPTEQHWEIFRGFLRESNAVGNLVYDAHLAALAVEHNCELHSSDQDFARFRGSSGKTRCAEKHPELALD